MRIFRRPISDPNDHNSRTTARFYIGSPEAEAETLGNSRVKLEEVFLDLLEILPQLGHEKFIVIGRKGSGKSAIAGHISDLASNDPNTFCEFVRQNDISIEKIIQDDSDPTKDRAKLLFEWLILIKIVKLITQNQALSNNSKYSDLSKFIHRNSGYVDIKEYQVTEYTQGQGMIIDITMFKRWFRTHFNKDIGIKAQRAPFYRLIPHLRETIISLLTSNEDALQGNEYLLLFDDLDIGFKADDKSKIELLVELIRITKEYNVNIFGKGGIRAKIILFLRDDLARIIKRNQPDTAKVLSSYSIQISWFEQLDFNINEDKVKLKQFIERRIEYNFEKAKIPMTRSSAWSSLIQDDNTHFGNRSSFKYVLDHTFYRPRDLLLFFLPISKKEYRIPLGPKDIDNLIILYSTEVISELKNELSVHYDEDEIVSIFEALRRLINRHSFLNYGDFKKELERDKIERSTDDIINDLFEYSIIGMSMPSQPTYVKFKHREKGDEIYSIDKEWNFIFHYPIEVYFTRNVRMG